MKTAIISVNFETEECRWTFCDDHLTAISFLASIVNDFKEWEHTIVESKKQIAFNP